MFVISNIEPFDTENDAVIAAEKLGESYSIYEVDVSDDEFDDDDLDEDEEEDLD